MSSELNAMVMPRALLCLALVPFSVHASEATLEDHDEEFWFTLYLSVGLFAAAVVVLARAPLCFGLCGCVRLCRRRLGRRRPRRERGRKRRTRNPNAVSASLHTPASAAVQAFL